MKFNPSSLGDRVSISARKLALANRKMNFLSLMTKGSFASWDREPTKVSLPAHRNREIGVLSSLMITVQRDDSLVFVKYISGSSIRQKAN